MNRKHESKIVIARVINLAEQKDCAVISISVVSSSSAIVLCQRDETFSQRFVVWDFKCEAGGDAFFTGLYTDDLREAIANVERRLQSVLIFMPDLTRPRSIMIDEEQSMRLTQGHDY